MKSILVPVDGSDSSVRAVKLAMQEMQEHKETTSLFLLTVQAPILSGNVTRFFSTEAIQDYYDDEGRNALRPAKALLDDSGVAYTEHVSVGPIASTIADFVTANNCDHIIMGTRGLGSVSSLMLGSVTTKVLTLVDVPVTLVK